MALTPANPRMSNPPWGASIKLTPSNSPSVKSTLRSPMKASRPEASLALRQVIGTTTGSANAFDSLPSGRSFAFTAGAAAVVATVEDGRLVSQRFFRARPTAAPVNPSGSVYGGLPTPAQSESRSRTGASLRDAGIGASPLASPVTDWSDSPQNRTWSARERIKAATCISFSPDGKYLAVGETGYKPRVLIFSTAPDAPSDTPLSSLSEHTYGVRCVAFSPDSQYLASLGSANDGFLYIWSINSRTAAASLYAINKCTSAINRIAWMGKSLITVGTRHVKVWRTEEPIPTSRTSKSRQSEGSFLSSSVHKTLPGRNCLLESLLDATFTSVVAVTPSKAIVASDRGDICLIDDTEGNQRFVKVADAGFNVTSLAVDIKGRLHVAGSQGGLMTLRIKEMIETLTPPPSPTPRVGSPTIMLTTGSHQLQAVAALEDYIVTVDSQHSIRISHLSATDDDSLVGDVVQKLSAHGTSVLGVTALAKPNLPDASFYTWSAEGSVLFWGRDGTCKESFQVDLDQLETNEVEANELKTVSVSADASYLVTGDKYGILRIIDLTSRTDALKLKAHASEITDIAIYEGVDQAYVACCARDRTVQILSNQNRRWEIMQTLDEHVGAVTGILFSRDGSRLVSCSSDRSLVVRELVSREEDGRTLTAFIMLRAVVLKATPVSIAWDADNDHVLLVSTIDRQVHRYDIADGQSLTSFRAADSDGGDAVVLSSLVHIPRAHGAPLIGGVSSTDKSIRLYDETGNLLTRDWGHTEGVSDIALVGTSRLFGNDENQGPKSLVTVAVDGTIFVWGLELRSPYRLEVSRSTDSGTPTTPTHQDFLVSKPPLRRVLSQSELARFQRSPDEERLTPAGNRSPKLRKRPSKSILTHTPKLEASPSMPRDRTTVSAQGHSSARRLHRNRSPSPPSPRAPQASNRRSSVDVRVRPKPSTNEFGSLGASTESLCRTLRAYRKRLANSTEGLSSELAREIERELAHTARAVGEKAKPGIDEAVMTRLLDQFSERLVNLLDEKITAGVALRVRENSEGFLCAGHSSPAQLAEANQPKGAERAPSSLAPPADTDAESADMKHRRTPSLETNSSMEDTPSRNRSGSGGTGTARMDEAARDIPESETTPTTGK